MRNRQERYSSRNHTAEIWGKKSGILPMRAEGEEKEADHTDCL